MPVQPGTQVSHRQARPDGAVLRLARHAHQPAHALDDLVKARPPRIRTILTKAGNAGQDDARVDGLERCVIQPQAVLHIGAPVFHHHIRFGNHPLEDVHCPLFLEVERHRTFVAVDVLKIAPLSVGGKHRFVRVHPFGWLDAHHVSTKIGQDAHAIGAGTDTGQVNDLEA